MKLAVLAVLSVFSIAAAAQTDSRGAVPPGSAADGSRPQDGAIQGGTILPGERGGVPQNAPGPERRIAKCHELSGTLRDECLRREQDAGAGASRPADPTKDPAPSAPPPQNPR